MDLQPESASGRMHALMRQIYGARRRGNPCRIDTSMAEHVLVTGGAGYVGSILVPVLLEQGYTVTVVDDFRYRANSLAACCANPRFAAIRADVRDAAAMRGAAASADWVIPLAALVGAPICERDPQSAESINLGAVQLLVSLLGRGQRVLFPSTDSAYGASARGAMCDETTPLRPVSLYGKTKASAEAVAMTHDNSIAFRLATLFGMSPRMRLDLLVNDFTHRAFLGTKVVVFEGTFRRIFLHVRDVAGAFLHGMANFERMRSEVYNTGLSSANLTKLELAASIKRHFPNFEFEESPVGRDPDQRDYRVSNAKLEATGWQPAYTLDDGIRELIKGYVTNGTETVDRR